MVFFVMGMVVAFPRSVKRPCIYGWKGGGAEALLFRAYCSAMVLEEFKLMSYICVFWQ